MAVAALRADLVYLDEQIDQLDQDMPHQASTNAQARKLQQQRGIGPITATALVAAIGQNAGQFKRGRNLAAWLGLTSAQHSSGGKDRQLGISKRGDVYLHTLLIHGARAVLRTAAGRSDRLSLWIQNLCSRRNKDVAAVALANKTARLVCTLLSREADYDPAYGLGGCNAT